MTAKLHHALVAAQLAQAAELHALRRALAGDPVDDAAALDAAVAGWRRALDHPALRDALPTLGGFGVVPTAVAPTEWEGALRPGAVIADRYRIARPLGAGGMGEVFLAEDLGGGEPVAIKKVRAGVSDEAIACFRHEIAAASRVVHPNVARMLDAVLDDGALYMVMEYLDGRSLRAHLVPGEPLPPDRALAVLRGACAGVAAAHAAGVVHRDLKPENLVLVDTPGGEQIKVVDFGIALVDRFDAHGRFTAASVVIGTPAYMAPEQIAAEEITPASDVYALAEIGVELYTGERLYAGLAPIAIAQRKMNERPEISAVIPDRVRGVLSRALAVRPADRYPDAGALLAALPAA